MSSFYSIFEIISEGTLVIYFFSLLIVVSRFRTINSTVVCILVVFMMESLMSLFEKPLLKFDSRELWYGTWIIMCTLTVFLLYQSHKVLKLNLAKVTNMVAFTYLVSTFIQIADYIDREHFSGNYLETFYPVAVHTINISLAAIILFTAIKHKKEKLVGWYV